MNQPAPKQNGDYVFVEREKSRERPSPRRVDLGPRSKILAKEKVFHGASITGLMALLILGAMGSVMLREISIHGMDGNIPRKAMYGVYLTFTLLGIVISLGTSFMYSLSPIQGFFRVTAGFVVGLAAATLVVVPVSSIWSLTFTTGLGSVLLALFAALDSRLRLKGTSPSSDRES